MGQRLLALYRRIRISRTAWACIAGACVLLALSEIVWLWHSWPVRQVLDAEQVRAGPSV
jgi:hypothetical protein